MPRWGLTTGVVYPRQPDGEKKRGLRRRHHLCHQQRARLRLPARQHARQPRGDGPARPQLRDRRRGRLDPDRRGADAADHLGPSQDRSDLYVSIDKIIPFIEEEHYTLDEKQRNATFTDEGNDFLEGQAARAGAAAGGAEPLRPRKHDHRAPRHQRAARAQAVHQGQQYIVRGGEVVLSTNSPAG
jgi:preprotein translocase subunit SecA